MYGMIVCLLRFTLRTRPFLLTPTMPLVASCSAVMVTKMVSPEIRFTYTQAPDFRSYRWKDAHRMQWVCLSSRDAKCSSVLPLSELYEALYSSTLCSLCAFVRKVPPWLGCLGRN
ncbi:hypothetical protein K438DRAFT_1848307, partial [Mycena galopus ATCC 62051]